MSYIFDYKLMENSNQNLQTLQKQRGLYLDSYYGVAQNKSSDVLMRL